MVDWTCINLCRMASAGKKDAVPGMKPHSRGSIGAKWMDETQCPDEVDPRMGLMCRTELQVAIKEGNAKRDSFFVVQIGKSSLAAPYQLVSNNNLSSL